jgi:hypothetical protein
MSFGNTSAVHDHLSTKHSLFPHRKSEDDAQDKTIEPLHDEERFAERAPPIDVERPLVRS